MAAILSTYFFLFRQLFLEASVCRAAATALLEYYATPPLSTPFLLFLCFFYYTRSDAFLHPSDSSFKTPLIYWYSRQYVCYSKEDDFYYHLQESLFTGNRSHCHAGKMSLPATVLLSVAALPSLRSLPTLPAALSGTGAHAPSSPSRPLFDGSGSGSPKRRSNCQQRR